MCLFFTVFSSFIVCSFLSSTRRWIFTVRRDILLSLCKHLASPLIALERYAVTADLFGLLLLENPLEDDINELFGQSRWERCIPRAEQQVIPDGASEQDNELVRVNVLPNFSTRLRPLKHLRQLLEARRDGLVIEGLVDFRMINHYPEHVDH